MTFSSDIFLVTRMRVFPKLHFTW